MQKIGNCLKGQISSSEVVHVCVLSKGVLVAYTGYLFLVKQNRLKTVSDDGETKDI